MENTLHQYCLEKSAQAWCQPGTSKLEMIPELAEEFAQILYKEISSYEDVPRQNESTQWIFGLKEFKNLRDQIQVWKDSNTGINSPGAQNMVDAVIDLCLRIKKYVTHNSNLEVGHPYHPATISENYSAPIQTGVNQWSVFVRKFKGHKECIGVIEHRFKTEKSAKIFSENNWCLGDYY